jgi:DNA-binding CsgD family transcriptional regulator
MIYQISPRQKEVLDLLVMGKRNKAIAEELGGISVRTVESHIHTLLEIFDCANRASLMAKVLTDKDVEIDVTDRIVRYCLPEIKQLKEQGIKPKDIAEILNVSKQHVYYCLSRKN